MLYDVIRRMYYGSNCFLDYDVVRDRFGFAFLTNKLISLSGRALFSPKDVAHDVEDTGEAYPAWMLFIWTVNDMVPETFATEGTSYPIIHIDEPGDGWLTEEYEKARVLLPPDGSDNSIGIVADDVTLYPIWDKAMQIVAQGGIHEH